MRFLKFILFLLIVNQGTAQQLAVSELTCEHKVDPMGIDISQPRLSWKIAGKGRNIMQSAYQLRVATDKSFSKKSIVWETGKLTSGESILQQYRGEALKPGQRYHWQVKVWDAANKASGWSKVSFFETGLISPANWKASWIEPIQDTLPDKSALAVRKEFNTAKTIASARAYVTSHGLYELYLNGQKVGDQVLTPGWTSYSKRLQYQVYDISGMIQQGKNTVGAMLGDGWYRGILGWVDNYGVWGKKLGLLCQLRLMYTDGSEELIVTDGSWKGTTESPIVLNSIYNGETYDARKEMSDWSTTGFNESQWKPVNTAEYNKDVLVATQTVPVKKIEELKPIKIFRTPRGTLVADFGQNMVGWIRLKVSGSAGTTVNIRHAEVLDKYGEFYTANLRSAKATATYILKGKGEEVYEPRFTFFGFRYVALEGFPGDLEPGNITGVVVHSDMKPTGNFECSNPLINQLQHNILWGQKGNFVDVPTDCPQRDERLGWTGDAQAFIRTAAYNMDVAAFFTKWLKDVAADQYENGGIPFVVPDALRDKGTSAGWADVATIAPWTIYQVYGDQQILETQYSSMKAYVEHIRKKAGSSYLWKGGSVFGDWLFYKSMQQTENDGFTSPDMIATTFYAYSTKLLAKVAGVLGKTDDEKMYNDLFEKIREAFNKNYVTAEGRVSGESQTSYVLALMFDLLPESLREKATNYLVDDIRGRGNHLSTGFLGTPYLCHVLTAQGRTDVAYDLLLQETFPSWLYPVKMGATTIWERWDGQKTDSTFQDVGMNSFNHYAYGAIGDWMYRVVAGIEIGKPGYKHILIQPQPNKKLTYANASLQSAYGTIRSGWETKNGKIIIKVSIPANTTATVTLPKTTAEKVTESGSAFAGKFAGIKELDGNTVLEIGSGEYVFEYATSLAVATVASDTAKLVAHLQTLAAGESNPLLKKHFESVALMVNDKTHDFIFGKDHIASASGALNFFQHEGSRWETYANGPRPLIMAFKSPTDQKNSFYWLFLPKNFDLNKKDYPFYLELHGSGGGYNDNPRVMLLDALQPEVAGVTHQGYRKEGLFILPWGRGDKGYKGISETDIFECLQDFDRQFKTDPSRQYLYGFSMGGAGTFHIAQKSMARWTAIGMYSAAFHSVAKEEANKFKAMPVWMAWGETESWAVNDRILKDYFLDAGVPVKWVEVKGVGHNYLGKYQEDLMNWFTQQVKPVKSS